MSSNDHNDPITTSPQATRPFSIDLSLELERQLESEEPSSPIHDSKSHPQQSRESLDPHILASIILQLRHSLAEATKERDDLSNLVPSLKDSLEHMTNKCTVMEEELHEARAKAKDDEEAISLLRSKVEESRRGLMRLQNESRRTSFVPAPIDVSRAGGPSMAALKSARRQSFTPRTGSGTPGGHARHASITDGVPVEILIQSASPNTAVFACETPGSGSHPPSSTRRLSSFFSRSSPEAPYDPIAHELEGLRREMETMKEELETTRTERDEAKEMRDASESCALALREYIAQNNTGADQSPVMSTPTIARPEPMRKATTSSGWGFGSLFNKTTGGSAEPNREPTVAAAAPRSSVSSWEQSPTVSNRKLGSFFNSRASVSSTSSQPLQVPFGHESDTSSIEETPEPISPSQDTNTKVRVSSVEASSSRVDSPIDTHSIDGGKPHIVPRPLETMQLA